MDDFRRGPQKENAHRVGSIVKGGACSLESAPISLILDFLKATQEHDLKNTEIRAKESRLCRWNVRGSNGHISHSY